MRKQRTQSYYEKQIRQCCADITKDYTRRAVYLYEAKEDCFENTLQWIEWAERTFNICRRQCFYARAVAIFLRSVDQDVHCSALLDEIRSLPFQHLAELAAVPVDQLQDFYASHDPTALSREDLRDVVSDFLGKARSLRQLEFISLARLPSAERLLASLSNTERRKKLQFEREATYARTMLRRALLASESLSDAQLNAFITSIHEDIHARQITNADSWVKKFTETPPDGPIS